MARVTQTSPDKPPHPIPGRIGGVLKVVLGLIAHARQFTAIVTTRIDVPEFAIVAAVLGTHDLPIILHRMQRGLLRALALQRYLLERAAKGRNLRFAWPPYVSPQPHHRRPTKPAPAPHPARKTRRQTDPALLGPDDPGAFRHLTPDELDAEVRRRPVGRTVALICLDLGIVPGLCDGDFWYRLERVLHRYGGSLRPMFRVRAKREETFQRERDRRPDTWHIDWQDLRPETVRRALGYRVGDVVPPPGDPMHGLPVIVPG